MADAARHDRPMSIKAFDAFMATVPEDVRYELVDGVAVMMTNPSLLHAAVSSNLGAALRNAAQARGCTVFFGSVAVQSSEAIGGFDKYIPDLVVYCGPILPRTFITDPLVVVEVLLPSTYHIDRGVKLEFFKTLGSQRHIIYCYQDAMVIEHVSRLSVDEPWHIEDLRHPEDVLNVAALDITVPLPAIYAGVPLAGQSRSRVPLAILPPRRG